MLLRVTALVASLWLFYPAASKAAILYTLSVDYSGINGEPAGSTLNWTFEVPSILTTQTTVTSFLSTTIGSGFSSFGGSCGSVLSASILAPPNLAPPNSAPWVSSSSTLWSGLCGVGNQFSGAAQQFLLAPDSLGVFDAYGHNGGSFLGTLTIANLTDLQGGPTSAPVVLNVPELAEIDGTIGGQGTQDYYSFNWRGGAFSATGIVGGSDGASYLFSEGVAGSCSSGGSATLSGGDGFAGTISLANLAPGNYCIGIAANSPNDPNFSINFATPLDSVPEPSGFLLLSIGLGMASLFRLTRRSRKSC
jgi:hypothetical protein